MPFPYQVGMKVSAVYFAKKVIQDGRTIVLPGTMLGNATVTKVEPRENGNYRVTVQPDEIGQVEHTYTVSRNGACDNLSKPIRQE